ncbi:hypothetical protein llap_12273 [Limosa lapponica baueri]|uniref:Uncharacterized protein n=1 Tax=Limosa lapponica baueri TaxID=1758121 RepID=A0A2I0TUG6_LIMLA|nr:hypothetical protein llap_12273 [Limosa lapponica baueri]
MLEKAQLKASVAVDKPMPQKVHLEASVAVHEAMLEHLKAPVAVETFSRKISTDFATDPPGVGIIYLGLSKKLLAKSTLGKEHTTDFVDIILQCSDS